MTRSRRDFLKASAGATAAASLAPLAAHAATVESAPPIETTAAESPAAIRAFERRLQKARPLPLGAVRITGGPLKNAQDLTAKYLLSLNPDRMMAHYRVRAGLKQKAEPYVGWDGGGRNLTGHIAGHHLSAVSIYYKVTGDAAFKKRADYLVTEMKEVQDKRGDGYLGAIMTNEPAKDGHEVFKEVSKGDIRSGAFDLNGLWSPWYTLHKTFAGLRDAYRHTGNKTALEVEAKFAKWAEGVLAPLSDEQLAKMHNTEFGGMNEVLVDLYADTGNKRWLDLSYKFEHRAFTDPLKRHQDNLSGKHGNCQIPKLIGSATRYGFTADSSDLVAAAFFHDRVAQHHSYATGGHGLAEYFGAPDQLSSRVDGRTCETCNCYNMLKLTRKLFAFTPDPTYADFHERTLFNHILASIDNEDGRTSYMVPVGRGVAQEYADMERSFTCCVGTGMESHGLHGDGQYYESDDAIWVNIYAPSTAQFSTQPVNLEMATGFPDGDTASIKVTAKSAKEFTLAVRRPVWAGDGFSIRVNGTAVPMPSLATLHDPGAGGRRGAPGNEAAQGSHYVPIKRLWKTGDVVEIALPKSLRLEPTPDNKTVAAIMWGPLVLAGAHGPRRANRGPAAQAAPPVLVTNDRAVSTWVSPVGTTPGDFMVKQVGRLVQNPSTPALDVLLTPFHRTHKKEYSVYFDVIDEKEYYSRVGNFSADRERARRLELATISFIAPGDPEAEKNYTYASDPADRTVARAGGGRTSRAGTGWFSYNMPVEPLSESALIVTYFTDIGQPPTPGSFQISVEGTVIARYEPHRTAQGYHDVHYPIPVNLTREKARVSVKFEALAGTPPGRIAPIFGVRVVRTKDLQ